MNNYNSSIPLTLRTCQCQRLISVEQRAVSGGYYLADSTATSEGKKEGDEANIIVLLEDFHIVLVWELPYYAFVCIIATNI